MISNPAQGWFEELCLDSWMFESRESTGKRYIGDMRWIQLLSSEGVGCDGYIIDSITFDWHKNTLFYSDVYSKDL